MALMTRRRRKVRLRLDKATALLHRPGVTSLLCVVSDLSEAGCQCHVSLGSMDEESARTWKGLLVPGLVVALEMSSPPELRGLVFHETEVRWVDWLKGRDTDLGVQLSNLQPEQKEILAKTLLSFAVLKLRWPTQTPDAPPPQETAPEVSVIPALAPPAGHG